MEIFIISFSYVMVFIIGVIVGVFVLAKPIVENLGNVKIPDMPTINEEDYMTEDGKYFTNKRKVKGDDE